MEYVPSGRAKGVVILEEESLGAGVLYDYWTYNAVQVHVYAPALRVLFAPHVLREIFEYPFLTCNLNLVMAVTPGDQKGSLAVSSWLGFKETYRIRDGWKVGVDMVMKELRREDCRFLTQDVKSA
jgi:hypothetical protein